MLDLSHKLLLVFFADGEPAEPQGTVVQLDRALPGSGPAYGARDMVWRRTLFVPADGRSQPGKHTFQIENRTGDRGRFWFVQYPFGFEPHLVEYEPFLSGKQLLLTPSFRELYKTQLVDESEGLKVSDMTYLFTDLKQSTPLYESVGDVNAYFLVRQHFEILNKIIRDGPAPSSRRSATQSWPASSVPRTPFVPLSR